MSMVWGLGLILWQNMTPVQPLLAHIKPELKVFIFCICGMTTGLLDVPR